MIVSLMVSSLIPMVNGMTGGPEVVMPSHASNVALQTNPLEYGNSKIISFSSYSGMLNYNLSDYNIENYSSQLSSYLDWTSQETYYDGNFYIVGGSGLISLNGSVGNYNMVKESSPSGGYCRFVLPDDGSLLLGGNYFDPPAGLYIFSYDPVNNSLTNLSGRIIAPVNQFGSENNIVGMQNFGNFTYVIYNQERSYSRLYIQKFNSTSSENISSELSLYGTDIITASGGKYMILIGGAAGGYSYLFNANTGTFKNLNNADILNSQGINCLNEAAYVAGNFTYGYRDDIYQYDPVTNSTVLLNSFPNYRVTFVSAGPSNSSLIGIYEDSYTTLLILNRGTYHDMGSYYGIINDATFSKRSGSILMIGDSLVPGKPVSYYLQLKSTYVYFVEEGLPSGMEWTLHLNGTNIDENISTTSNETDLLLTYGNYTLRATSQTRTYYTIPETIDVDYQGIVIHIDFMPYYYNATFLERGLPANLSWNLEITSQKSTNLNYTINSNIFSLRLLNGTYIYHLKASSNLWFSFNSSGKFTINGSSVNILIQFVRAYVVKFNIIFPYVVHQWFINGSLGTKYNFNLSGNNSSAKTYLPNGTYIYQGSTTEKKFYNSGGNFTINGNNISLNIEFIPYLYNITVVKNTTENTGYWGICFNNTTLYEDNNSEHLLTVKVTNGTYFIKFFNFNSDYRPKVLETVLKVDGSPIKYYLDFVPSFYIIFSSKEVLQAKWSVDLHNSSGFEETGNLSGRNFTFILPNGTYHFQICYFGYHIILYPNVGNIFVDGKNLTINLTPEDSYSVNFSENNLLNGTQWYLNVTTGAGYFNGSSNLSYIDLCLPDGNFIYSATSENKIFAFQTGSGLVNGFNTSLSVAFTVVRYQVTFSLNNPSGMNFLMNITESPVPFSLLRTGLSNVSVGEGSGLYIMYLVNGTYKLNAHLLNRTYTLNGFTFTINGSSNEYRLNLHPYLYLVQFILNSTGVSGSWSVNGINAPTSLGINIYAVNGTHNYTIQGPTNVFVNKSEGTFTIKGKNITIYVSFIRKNEVQIVETYGLNYIYQALNTIENSYLNIFVLGVIALVAYSSYRANASIRKLRKAGSK
ncbi:hypothetical protein [Cuniculiplasma sp. SKW4]|uniref:hypothetical protein n=1 Tax=Cuniculiplasma sp. SKW4 TaxID=3400171 RepID=UPI003FD09FFC